MARRACRKGRAPSGAREAREPEELCWSDVGALQMCRVQFSIAQRSPEPLANWERRWSTLVQDNPWPRLGARFPGINRVHFIFYI